MSLCFSQDCPLQKLSRLGEAQSMRALVPKQLLITEILVTQHGPVQAARQIRALEGQRPPADAADLEWGRAHLEFQVGPAWTSVTCRWSGLSKKQLRRDYGSMTMKECCKEGNFGRSDGQESPAQCRRIAAAERHGYDPWVLRRRIGARNFR